MDISQLPDQALCGTFDGLSSRTVLHIQSRTEANRIRESYTFNFQKSHLCVVLCLTGGAELSRALVLVLFHTHLYNAYIS